MKVCEKCGEPERDCCCKRPKLVNQVDTEETPKEYLARIGAEGGKKSHRKLTKKEARRIAKVRWAAGAGVCDGNGESQSASTANDVTKVAP